jgi:hypothetical protein
MFKSGSEESFQKRSHTSASDKFCNMRWIFGVFICIFVASSNVPCTANNITGVCLTIADCTEIATSSSSGASGCQALPDDVQCCTVAMTSTTTASTMPTTSTSSVPSNSCVILADDFSLAGTCKSLLINDTCYGMPGNLTSMTVGCLNVSADSRCCLNEPFVTSTNQTAVCTTSSNTTTGVCLPTMASNDARCLSVANSTECESCCVIAPPCAVTSSASVVTPGYCGLNTSMTCMWSSSQAVGCSHFPNTVCCAAKLDDVSTTSNVHTNLSTSTLTALATTTLTTSASSTTTTATAHANTTLLLTTTLRPAMNTTLSTAAASLHVTESTQSAKNLPAYAIVVIACAF